MVRASKKTQNIIPSFLVPKSFFERNFLVFVVGAGLALVAITAWFFVTFDKPGLVSLELRQFFQIAIGLLILISVLLLTRIIGLWLRFRARVRGSQLHFRIMTLFGLVSIIPAVVMIVFSSLFFHYGVQSWFNNKVQGALNQSLNVARSYLEEHENIARRDATELAKDLQNNPDIFGLPQDQLKLNFKFMARDIRSIREAIVMDQNLQIIARTPLTFSMGLEYIPPKVLKKLAQQVPGSKPFLLKNKENNRLRALVKLNTPIPMYLMVGRYIDQKVLSYLRKAEENVDDYQRLSHSKNHLEITFTLVFLVISLIVVLVAILFGMRFANKLLYPLEELALTVQKMSDGDLSVRVQENKRDDEINALKRAFNSMAEQLEGQRADLISINVELSNRRQFIESVLANISTGVINVSADQKIIFCNEAVNTIFHKDFSGKIGKKLTQALPFFKEILQDLVRTPQFLHRRVIIEGKEHTLSIKIHENPKMPGQDEGYLITVEDVTDLLAVQRKAASADVARQIAHEIKNPLTPIQLATERLRKKFIKQIETDQQQFSDYIETIMRYVQQIQRLINAFSDFSRLPTPKLESVNIKGLVEKTVSLQKTAYPSIQFKITGFEDAAIVLSLDPNLMSQALTNILKNAIEALSETQNPSIKVEMSRQEQSVRIKVSDNGTGFPKHVQLEELFSPYTSFSSNGTGLGLGIVKNIIEQHHGKINLRNGASGGARVEIILPMV